MNVMLTKHSLIGFLIVSFTIIMPHPIGPVVGFIGMFIFTWGLIVYD